MRKNNTYTPISDSDIVDSPIEYKQLNTEDFAGLQTRKDTLDIGVDGYLSEITWEDYINLDEHNTVVINSSVGQGKSYFARLLAKKYYMARDEDGAPLYTIVFAAPYKSLVEQYIDDIKADLSEEGIEDVLIPDYSNLVEYDEEKEKYIDFAKRIKEASSQRLHIITINCLLGNPGENAIEQSQVKQAYLNSIIKKCRDEGRKIILFADEIHDAIHNFKQELIFNLWKFRTNYVLHKAFILSATFNEASKVVIKYIAELTSKSLQIIETKRLQNIEELSRLHIHLTKEDYYDFERGEFKELFGEIIKKHDTLNILSYSRKICTELADGTNGKSIRNLLIEKYRDKINICIPEDHHPSIRQRKDKEIPNEISYSEKYQKRMCNIGTTFKTGISIKEENSGLVIILPSGKSMQGFWTKEKYGIFNNGIITLIQALARVRYKSDIYVIMPFPTKFIITDPAPYFTPDDYLSKLDNINIFKYRLIKHTDTKYQYYSEHNRLIFAKYVALRKLVTKEIKMVKDFEEEGMRKGLPDLNYSTLERFILEKGELYLHSNYAICGKDLSAYMIWAAFHNQFVNCKLTGVSSSKVKEEVEVDNVPEFLFSIFIVSEKIAPKTNILSDIELYDKIFGILKSDYIIYTKDSKEEYNVISDSTLKKYIMAFIQRFFKGNIRMSKKYLQIIEHAEDKTIGLTDDEFTKEDYLLCSMANSLIFDVTKDELIDNTSSLIDAYQNLYKIREIFREKLILPFDGEIGYIYPTFSSYLNNPLNDDDINLIITTFDVINKDRNYRVFNKNGINLSSTEKALAAIYNILKGTFFQTKEYREPTGDRERKLIVKELIDLPKNRSGINLLYKYPYNREENYESRADYLSIATEDEYIEGYYDEDNLIDLDNKVQDLLNTVSTFGNDETIDSNNDNQHIDNIQDIHREELTEEHKPDEPDNSEITDEQQKTNDRELPKNDNNKENDNNQEEENQE